MNFIVRVLKKFFFIKKGVERGFYQIGKGFLLTNSILAHRLENLPIKKQKNLN